MFTRRWKPLGEPNGKTVLLIHGLASSSLTWISLARHLSDMGYSVVAPDLTGHGRSPRTDKYSVQQWTEDIVSLGLQPNLIIGHSIGGLIAANLTNYFSDARTVLIDPVFRLPTFKPLLGSIQYWFARYMINAKPKTTSPRRHMIEFASVRQWDAKSIEALREPREISKTFLESSSNALLIRAHRSYIFPRVKNLRDGLHFEDYKNVGHNVHLEAFDKFKDSLANYLETSSVEEPLAA